MKTKITFNQIIEQAKTLTANGFDKFLNENRIDYDVLDSDNIMDVNEGFYNIRIISKNFNPTTILFCDGEYQDHNED